MSTLSLRVDYLPLKFEKALMALIDHLDPTQIAQLCNTLWCVWKAREKGIFTTSKPTPQGILRQASRMEAPSGPMEHRAREAGQPHTTIKRDNNNMLIGLVNASWDTSKKAGWGLTLFDSGGSLIRVYMRAITTEDLFHAEAVGLLEALKECSNSTFAHHMEKIHLMSDCKNLVEIINMQDMGAIPSWQATETMATCIQIVQAAGNKF